jgi:hypothetical protein
MLSCDTINNLALKLARERVQKVCCSHKVLDSGYLPVITPESSPAQAPSWVCTLRYESKKPRLPEILCGQPPRFQKKLIKPEIDTKYQRI